MTRQEPRPDAGQAAPSWAGKRRLTTAQARQASRRGWDADARRYQREHGDFLAGPGGADLVWCPEGWLESEVALLGDPQDLANAVAVDLGCGAGQAARFLSAYCRQVIGIDLSFEQLAHGRTWFDSTPASLVQADACDLPLPASSVDVLVSAFGVLAFVPDLDPVFAEISRVLTAHGSATLSMPHPIRWVFPDDPSAESLSVVNAYSDRSAYVEADSNGEAMYVECHHTLADIMNSIARAHLRVDRMWEPDWRADPAHVWGGWSSETVALVPRTLIVRLVPC